MAEVAGIDVKEESPVGHGHLTCFSIYCGEDADFGRNGATRQPKLVVDVMRIPATQDKRAQ